MSEYIEPIFWSDCMLMELSVEKAINTISNTKDPHVRDTLLMELHMHQVDYPCPKLRRALQQLNAMLGHKPFTKQPTMEGINAPLYLENTIFREDNDNGNKIDMRRLWSWIYEIFVKKLAAKYEWIALLLFAKGHGLLKEDETSKFCKQMKNWYETKHTRQICNYDQVNCYRKGFFSSPTFSFRQWVGGDGNLPASWTPADKDQKKDNYPYIHQHCVRMEENFIFGKIIVLG